MARWIWISFFRLWIVLLRIIICARNLCYCFSFNSKIKGAKLFIIQLLHFCAESLRTQDFGGIFFGGKKNWENINKKEDNKFWRQNIGVFVFLFWFVNQQMIQESSKQKKEPILCQLPAQKIDKSSDADFSKICF